MAADLGAQHGRDDDPARALWRRARQQLSDHELTLHETQLELTNETRACQQQKEATAKLLKEAGQLRAMKAELESGALQLYGKLQAVHQACEAEKADATALARTLDMAKQRLQAAEAARNQARAKRTQQLQEQQAHNDMLTDALRAATSQTAAPIQSS